MVTDEMLKRAVEAYAKDTGAEDWQLEGWIEPAIRAALEAALAAAEPVMYVSRNGSSCSPAFYESLVDRSRKNWQPLFAAPPALSAQVQDVAGCKLVPVEPTQEMLDAADHVRPLPEFYLTDAYRAMLSAAPAKQEG